MEQKLNNLEYWYKITLNIGIISLIDILTPGVVHSLFGVEIGMISGAIYFITHLIIGEYALYLANTILMFTPFFFVWLATSAILKRKINKLKKV